MKIKSQKDFFSGLMFMGVGIAFAWGATTYNIGEGARMGPGYFPLVLGILLAGLGAFTVFESMVVETEDGEPVGKWAWKPLGFIIGSNIIFGLLLGGLPAMAARNSTSRKWRCWPQSLRSAATWRSSCC